MTQFSEHLLPSDTDAAIRYRHGVRYLLFQQIAELRALKRHGFFPWAHAALWIEIRSRLNALGGIAGEW
ncbi:MULTISPECIES: hypothetical protein [pseudomallei group]|uniref:Uncharacterized protein n=1 Tax=Burkholderia oklahomensis TaxID=342113 RepID=A0AAI8B436_9BURK|nr:MULTISPECIES: hypothetical protein [pseudomallei group]AIO65703.1 hypothetical protein DM82_3317 [Burkholderia oklahomensis]AOI43979.1 hypothetical protein WG70_31525 [Burkholderia oklahomensis EO147]ARK88508.1 hypothetical protein BOC42_15020 [Burkholderia pseudomallei]KUY52485.1 hypothetical protein WG70_14580 [Burkholderia oklahomensis EO147]QPS38742.1 hypothetical protein I6G57_07955 [Burkholderia oklahomensis]